MEGDNVTHTDETCDNCGAGLLKVEPADAGVAYICDPDFGCGMVDRYE